MSDDIVEKVEKVGDGLSSTHDVAGTSPIPTATPNKDHFDSLMQEEKASIRAAEKSGKTSLMDAVRDMNYSNQQSKKPTTQSLLAQTEQVISKIDAVKETLASPDISIKSPAHVKMLQNKLSHIDENLKIALSKAGVEFGAESPKVGDKTVNQRVNPIERFLGYLTDGQYQLEHLGSELESMAINNKELSPVNMLAIQVKVGQIQQEMDLFSSLLSKTLESIKTVMNVQV